MATPAISVYAALFVGFLLLPIATAAEDHGAPARVICDLKRTDLMFHRGERQRVDVPFSIPGELPFVVKDVRRSCSCVAVFSPDSPLAPSVPQRLVMTMDAGELLGTVEAYVQIIGTVGDAPAAIDLLLHGEVRYYVEWPPGPTIDLGTHAVAELPLDLRIQLLHGRHPQHIDAVSATATGSGGIAQASFAMTTPDHWDVTFHCAGQGVCGVLSGEIELSCIDGARALPYHPRHPFRVTIVGPLVAHPGGILFGPLPGGTQLRKEVALEGRVRAVQATASDPSRLHCTLGEEGGRQVLQSEFTSSGSVGNASGTIDVDLQGGGVLRIPYYASVLPRAVQEAGGIGR